MENDEMNALKVNEKELRACRRKRGEINAPILNEKIGNKNKHRMKECNNYSGKL